MNRIRVYDPVLFWLALATTLLGMVFIFDAGYARALAYDKGALPPEFRSQLIFVVPAVLVSLVATAVRPAKWMAWSAAAWILTLIALVAVEKFGREMNGARRWIGAGSLMLQPAEFAKITAVLYLAGYFTRRKLWPKKIEKRKDFFHWLDTVAVPKFVRCLPFIVVMIGVYLIEKEPDLGTAAVIAATAFAMFFPGNVTKKSIAAAMALSIIGSVYMIRKEPYRLERIVHHAQRWDPKNVDDETFQTVQSELAISSGGVFGVGIGNGRAKHVLPATTTDFIMATVGEETGLVGSLITMGLIGGIVWRLFFQAKRISDRFGALVLYGVGSWFGIQACVNVMMANGFLPAIGIPLPFISSGGSSLVALWLALGVCQSIIAPVPETDQDSSASNQEPKSRTVRYRRSTGHVPPSRTPAVHR